MGAGGACRWWLPRAVARPVNPVLSLSQRPGRRWLIVLIAGLLVGLSWVAATPAYGHGGVVLDDDLCFIRSGYLIGHFKVHQPRTSGHVEYCEVLPDPGETLFVMEYLHSRLSSAQIGFRIIRNVTGQAEYANYADVEALGDLTDVTVFYQAPQAVPDVFAALHTFDEAGDYLGIVTASEGDESYNAVFPFQVGYDRYGYWPLMVVAVLLVQLNYLWMTGRLTRFTRRWTAVKGDVD